MSFLLLGLGLLCFWIYWGFGLALWVLPYGWRRFLWTLCVPFGLALQIAIAWWIAQLGVTIATWGPWTNLLPALLLVGAVAQPGNRRWLARALRSRTLAATGALLGLALLLALLPLATSRHHTGGPTTISFGSCDAPDYAMGARLFLEKGRAAHGGFWSQTEVHQLPEGMTFWAYWTQLNHFGPAALLAMGAASFHLEVWQLMTVLAAMLGASGAPLVLAFGYWALGLRWRSAVGVGALYAMSPLWLYGVYHVALAQLVGTLGVATWLLLAARLPQTGRMWTWLAAVVSGAVPGWLLISSYPFMAVFAVAIIGGVSLWHALERRSWAPLRRIVSWGLGIIAVCAVLFPARMLGAANTIFFYGNGAFGWPIGLMQFPAVIGLTADIGLNPHDLILYGALDLLIDAFWILGVLAAWRRRDQAWALVLVVCAVVLGGACLLTARDPTDAGLSSYKAYKLVAVFLPVLLPSLFIGLKPSFCPKVQRVILIILVTAIVVLLPRSLHEMWVAAAAMPLRLTPGLVRVETLEQDPAITSLNLVMTHPWKRLWASVFLANKEQHFAETTYISRAAGPLLGAWTLEDDRGLYPATAYRLGDGLVLHPASDPALVSLSWGKGWWGDEGTHRWSGKQGRSFSLMLEAAAPMSWVEMCIDGWFLDRSTCLQAFIGGQELSLRQNRQGMLIVEGIALPAGSTEIRFDADRDPQKPGNQRDARTLLLAVKSVVITQSNGVTVR